MNQPISPRAADLAAEAGPIAARFASFAGRLAPEAIPAEVVGRAKLHLLDATGIALASTTYDFAQHTANAFSGLAGAGEAPVFGMALRLPLRDAVHLNGVLAHGLDFDDTHSGAVTHLTASLWPTVFGVALREGASGEEALAAYLAGIECGARIGIAAKGGFHAKGFHPTGLVGAFACAIAAGWLMDLSEPQLGHAQGIVLSMASGSLEFLADGAWTKRMHPGWAGVAGITAAALAKQGFVGPGAPYEGRYGLFNAYTADGIDLAGIADGLGERWEMANVAFKPFPACHFNHAFIDAALALRRQGVRPDEIASITARIGAGPVPVVCEPEAQKKRPGGAYEAQFSVHYVVAAALQRGRFTLAELDGDALSDPAILALADKVGYEVNPASAYPRYYDGEVVATLQDGCEVRHLEAMNRGSDGNPIPPADIVAKFHDNAARAVSRRRARRIHDAVMALDRAIDLDDLADAVALA
jgi:2-methylcitrate dehydratase PrpD